MLAFVHIEKCGGTTLLHQLRRGFGIDHFDVIPKDKEAVLFGADDMRALLKLRPSVKSIAGHSVRIHSGLESVVERVSYYTILRDPVARYISDYQHFVDLLDFPDDFERWLDFEARHNFQTRAIAGSDDLEAAKTILRSRFDLVGLVEEYGEFLEQLSLLSPSCGLSLECEVRNSAEQRKSHRKPLPLDQFREQIIENNRMDLALYEDARDVLLPEQRERFSARCEGAISTTAATGQPRRHPLRERTRASMNRLYRNLIYKPYLGYAPFRYHALPPYRKRSKRD